MIQKLFNGLMKNMRMAQSCPDRFETVYADDAMLPEETRPRSASEDHSAPAAWDDKRETCANCKHIFLKFLSPAAGFCSLDCHATAAYLLDARSKAAPTADVDEPVEVSFKPISIHVPETPLVATAVSSFDESMEEYYMPESYVGPHTFSDFHTEKLAARAVEWSFSALY
ncbi:hypothetical protein ACHHYP_08245 [Achlya hypogyna]|uniref:Uncharacterized protein n=1 Tax=Achlya hypogyna TaxID=1202772 RepID=A0A1V9ZL50_ACHHY|nr:hypothetical protein ACHHYP_08245 [Achlya hypogyna]